MYFSLVMLSITQNGVNVSVLQTTPSPPPVPIIMKVNVVLIAPFKNTSDIFFPPLQVWFSRAVYASANAVNNLSPVVLLFCHINLKGFKT